VVTVGALSHIARWAARHAQCASVLEVGSKDYNGSVRYVIEPWGPRSYIGVDIAGGEGVDRVCRAEDLEEEFGTSSFDLVVAAELIEHTREWRQVVRVLKHLVRPDGVLAVTTRSKGFPLHGYPHDYWRYELSDFERIFADMEVLRLEPDQGAPGVCLTARKPRAFEEVELSGIALHSVVLNRRVRDLDGVEGGLRWRLGTRKAQLEDLVASYHASAHKTLHYLRTARGG